MFRSVESKPLDKALKPVEKNGFTVIDMTPHKRTFTQFLRRPPPQPVGEIDTMQPRARLRGETLSSKLGRRPVGPPGRTLAQRDPHGANSVARTAQDAALDALRQADGYAACSRSVGVE